MKLSMARTVSLKLLPVSISEADTMARSMGLSLSDGMPEDVPSGDMRAYLNPQESDYIYIPVRALTATSVQSDTINFGYEDGKALKEAVDKFNDIPVLKDHIFSVDNWIGRTQGSFWDSTTPGAPPGVTLMLKVDTKADPKVARGLLSGMLDSVSVTVQFDYVKSHPNMSDSDFYYKLGEVVDGKTVQALVTSITRLYELSVVWQGADVYAKQVQEDGIHTPGLSHRTHQSPNSKEEINMKNLAKRLGLAEGTHTEEQLLAALDGAITAAKTEAVTPLQAEVTQLKQDVAAKDTALTEANASLTQLKAELAPLKESNEALQQEVATLKPKAELGDAYLTEQRTEAARLYSIVTDGKPDANLTKLISEANLEAAKGFIATFGPQAEAKVPLTCSSCGSKSVSRRTSQGEQLNGNQPTFVDKAVQAHLKTTVHNMH